MSWVPLLPAGDAEDALDLAREIAAELERWDASPEARAPLPLGRAPFSLSGGSSGQALFFAYLDRAFPGEGYDDLAVERLQRAFGELGQGSAQLGLWAGLTGVAWTLEHLRTALVEEGEDPGEDVARRIAGLLATRPWPLEYDLISGLAGYGVYALERRPLPFAAECLGSAVARLEERAERNALGISWWTRDTEVPPSQRLAKDGHYNLGTAHGVPGVIGFLGQLSAAGLGGGQARELLDGAVPWLLAQQDPAAESLFPRAVTPGEPHEPARLAWCYGDLGVAAALLVAARGRGEEAWRQAAAGIARAAAARPRGTAHVRDAGICHGAAGNAHLFNRIWQETGDPAFAAAARTWLDEALAMRRPGAGIAGYLAYVADAWREPGWRPDPGLLTGAAGIGLVLLAAATPIEPAWDRLLLAS
jgi:lantibiotic modifying enzyme